MTPVAHPGRLLKQGLDARKVSAIRLALDISVPSGRTAGILNGKRSIADDTAVRLGLYFDNNPQFWLGLQSQFDIARVQRDRGEQIARDVRPPIKAA